MARRSQHRSLASAKTAVKSAIGDQSGSHVLIISAKAGGCSGYLYDMVIVERPNKEDSKSDVDGVTILIHDNDSSLLNGLKLDYKDSIKAGSMENRMQTGPVAVDNHSDDDGVVGEICFQP